jgi:iron complex outermembrane receptor protein
MDYIHMTFIEQKFIINIINNNINNLKWILMATAIVMPIASVAAQQTQQSAALSSGAGTQANSNDDGIEEITVVARKRTENVQLVPIPITVLTGSEVERDNLTNFTNFQYKFPAFSVYLTNPKQINIGVRGIGNNGSNTDGIDASVGVFVDGVYTGRLGMVSSDFSDLDHVELLRGPQGNLFGKNTTAGAVIMTSRKPSFTNDLDAEVTEGNFGLNQYKISASGPLVDDKLAVRVSAFYTDRDGVYKNIYNGSDENARQGVGARIQLLFTPTDDLTLRIIGSRSTQQFNSITPITISVYNPAALQARMAAAGYTLLTSNSAQKQVNIDGKLQSYTASNFLSGELNWDLGDYGTITSITGIQSWYCHTYNDNDYTQLNALPDYGSCNRERQVSEEVRWASTKDGPVEAVAGAFFSGQHLMVDSRIQFGNQYNIWAANPSTASFPNVGGLSWAQGAYASRLNGFKIQSNAHFNTDTQAVFGQSTWHPDEDKKWDLTVGLRQTFEQKNMNYNGYVTANPGNLTQAQINTMSASGANAQLGSANDSVNDLALSGQFGVSYHFDPDLMAYAQFSRGHKSKGFNLLAENFTNPDPNVLSAIAHGATQDVAGERADNLEVGVKSEWLQHHLLLNATLFDELVKNYQANESVGVGNTSTKFLANVGFIRTKGAELEAEAKLLPGLSLQGFLSYDDATYASFHNAVCPAQSTATVCDLTGSRVAWTPRWTSDLTLSYSREVMNDVTGYIEVENSWRTSQNTTVTLDPTANIQSYSLTNIRVGAVLLDSRLDVQLWTTNAFDKAYYVNILGLTKSTGIVQGYPGDPRTFGATLRYRY